MEKTLYFTFYKFHSSLVLDRPAHTDHELCVSLCHWNSGNTKIIGIRQILHYFDILKLCIA